MNRFGRTHLVRRVHRFRHQLKRNHWKATQAKRATATGYAAQSAVPRRPALDVSTTYVGTVILGCHSFNLKDIKHLFGWRI